MCTNVAAVPMATAIIPTHLRADLVVRAVRSALLQTYRNLEILVIIDGPEPGTADRVRALSESRIRVLELQKNVGISEVRNIGAGEAKGKWVSFLSDDDEWLPEKIDRQIQVVRQSDPATTLVGCRWEARGTESSRIMPGRFPLEGEDLSEYLFCRSGFVTPASLIRRDVICSVPYRKGLQNNEDNDWLFRVRAANLLKISWADGILAIIHAERERRHLSTHTDWRPLLDWARTGKAFLTPRSFASFLLRHCVPLAKQNGEKRTEMLNILRLAWRDGVPNAEDMAYAFAFAMAPNSAFPLCRRVWRSLHDFRSRE